MNIIALPRDTLHPDDIEQWIEVRRRSGRGDAEILAELSALIAPSR
jgi:hypothetical protein